MSWNTTLLKRSARLATSIGTVVLAALALGGCVGSKRQSRRCEWPTETPRRLDLAQSGDRAHVRRDAESAVAIAIHYYYGSTSLRNGPQQYAQAPYPFMASLLCCVARTSDHHIVLSRA